MNRKILLDAGPIVALVNRADRHHEKCVDQLTSISHEFITCEPVIAEACFIVRSEQKAIRDILRNVSEGHFDIVYDLAPRAGEVERLLSKYADQPMSLADACLVDMAGLQGAGRILTLDSDFRVYRWGRNKPFELLIDF